MYEQATECWLPKSCAAIDLCAKKRTTVLQPALQGGDEQDQ